MEKRGWKIIAITFIITFLLLFLYSFFLWVALGDALHYEARSYCRSDCLNFGYHYAFYQEEGCFCTDETIVPEIYGFNDNGDLINVTDMVDITTMTITNPIYSRTERGR